MIDFGAYPEEVAVAVDALIEGRNDEFGEFIDKALADAKWINDWDLFMFTFYLAKSGQIELTPRLYADVIGRFMLAEAKEMSDSNDEAIQSLLLGESEIVVAKGRKGWVALKKDPDEDAYEILMELYRNTGKSFWNYDVFATNELVVYPEDIFIAQGAINRKPIDLTDFRWGKYGKVASR